MESKYFIKKLQFDGIFQGRESEIRITPDNMISVFDFIRVAGGQKNPKQTWTNIQNTYKNEIVHFLDYSQFGKTKKTPVISVQGMVKLLFWLPGEMAKQFRSKSAEIMIRYLGGDITLIDEIKKIDQEHIDNPNNIAQVFRQEVNRQNLLFNQDQINTSNRLIDYFGNKKDIFYLFSFLYLEKLYAKFGIVGEIREFHKRVQEHVKEFETICFHSVLQCSNIDKVESDFKETALYNMNKVKIPKKNGGNHVEVIKLSEIITTSVIKEEMIRVAGERMIDPPPVYQAIENTNCVSYLGNIDIQKEITKQEELKTKQKELEINLEMKKLELNHLLEMKKLDLSNNASQNQELTGKMIDNQETQNVSPLQIPIVKQNEQDIIEFLNDTIIYSNNPNDKLSINDQLYPLYLNHQTDKKSVKYTSVTFSKKLKNVFSDFHKRVKKNGDRFTALICHKLK